MTKKRTGLPTQMLCAWRNRVVCTSPKDWCLSASAESCYRSSTTLVASTLKNLHNKLARKAGSAVALDSPTSVAEWRTPNWLLSITDNINHPLPSTVSRQRSVFINRLLSLICSTDRLGRSFLPYAVRLFNASQEPWKQCRVLDLHTISHCYIAVWLHILSLQDDYY